MTTHKQKPSSGDQLTRELSFKREAIDESKRTITLAFASETPYERWFGDEILVCDRAAVRMTRMERGANLLLDHDWQKVIGVVESVTIGVDRVCRAVVRFGKSALAEEIYTDVLDGIRTSVSVGYLIHKMVLQETDDSKDAYRVEDWEPFEISLVSVPADITVGVGRSQTSATAPNLPKEKNMENTSIAGVAEAAPAPVDEARHLAPATMAAQPAQPTQAAQRNHSQEIANMAKSNPALRDLAMAAIQSGHSVDQFQSDAIRHLSNQPVANNDIGLSQKEVRQYSLMRAIRALANPTDAPAQRAAAFELECSNAMSEKIGRDARGLFVPSEVQRRDLTVGVATDGGHTVATNLLSGSFIEMLRNAMVLDKMGITVLSGLVGQIAIPKQTGGATAYWVAENASPNESQQAFGQVTMSPKTVGGYTDISRKLLLQSSIDVESFVQSDLATTLGLAIQSAAIAGTGANNQPSGILKQVTPSVIGGANGGAPTFAQMVALETAVAVANADVGTLGYLTNTKVRGRLKTTETFTGTNGNPVWGSDNTVNGYQAKVTNAVPSNLTKGTANGVCSAAIFGNWADLVIGMWGVLDLLVDPYTNSTSGAVRVVALQDVDIALRNAESFATAVDLLTA